METLLIALAAVVLFSMAYAALSAAPWVPTKKGDIDRLIRLADLKPGETVYELGCGDARVLIKLAKKTGTRGVGVELSILQLLVAKLRAALSRTGVQVRWRNLFHTNLGNADLVYLFLMPDAYAALRKKFEAELKPGARVVSYVWPIPGWEPKTVDRRERSCDLYLYQR
jgi:SAM-dependent methyltransferase